MAVVFLITVAVRISGNVRGKDRFLLKGCFAAQAFAKGDKAAFLKQVREQWPDVIRMVISGYTDAEDIISAVNDAGIYQYITKPWHPDNLILTLKNAVRLGG